MPTPAIVEAKPIYLMQRVLNVGAGLLANAVYQLQMN